MHFWSCFLSESLWFPYCWCLIHTLAGVGARMRPCRRGPGLSEQTHRSLSPRLHHCYRVRLRLYDARDKDRMRRWHRRQSQGCRPNPEYRSQENMPAHWWDRSRTHGVMQTQQGRTAGWGTSAELGKNRKLLNIAKSVENLYWLSTIYIHQGQAYGYGYFV